MQELTQPSAEEIDWTVVRPILEKAITELNETDQDAILLRFFRGSSFASIGSRLRMTENAARMRVDRALDKLAATLSRHGITSTAAAVGSALAQAAMVAAPTSLATSITNHIAEAAMGPLGKLGIIHVMNTSTGIVVAASAILILAISVAVYETNVAHTAETHLASTHERLAAQEADVRALNQRLHTLKQETAKTREDAIRSAIQQAATRPATNAQPRNLLEEGRAFMAAHPEVKQSLIARFRGRVVASYGRLYSAWGLTPAEIERFELIQLDGPGGFSVDGIMLPKGSGVSRDEVMRQTRELLGEDRFQQYLHESELQGGRIVAAQLASALYHTNTPLTAAQGEQIARLFKQHTLITGPDWNGMLESARPVLSEQQMATLTGLRAEALFQKAASRMSKPQK